MTRFHMQILFAVAASVAFGEWQESIAAGLALYFSLVTLRYVNE